MSELTPHRFRDGNYRVRRLGDEIACFHVGEMRELCRYTKKGYQLAMSLNDGTSPPQWIEAEHIRIGIGAQIYITARCIDSEERPAR